MKKWLRKHWMTAVAFLLGSAVTHFFGYLMKMDDRRYDDVEQRSAQKREAYIPFLKELESILVNDSIPPQESLNAAREKFVQIEIDGSDEVILASGLLLRQLESQSRGIRSSHDYLNPVYREWLLELVRSELHDREPDLKEIEAKFFGDPLFAWLAGIPSEPKPAGTVEVLFEMDARDSKEDTKSVKND